MYDTILSPLTLGGVTLKNRVIFAPTTLGCAARRWQINCSALLPAAVR